MRAIAHRIRARWQWVALLSPLVGTCLAQPTGFAAETADPVPMTKMLVVLKINSEKPVEVRTSFQERPPTITIRFPDQRVIGSLPERSTVTQGVIQSITARYTKGPRAGAESSRFIQSLQIVLSAPYAYRVRSEAGRVIVEIEHPASVGSTSLEVGLAVGTIIGGIGDRTVSERFRAMQEALANAAPTAWTLQMPLTAAGSSNKSASGTAVPAGVTTAPAVGEQPALTASAGQQIGRAPRSDTRAPAPSPMAWWAVLLPLVAAAAAGSLWWFRGRLLTPAGSSPSRGRAARLPSGVVLIDQLVWRAFERQGYQLVLETELTQQPLGTLRIIMKDGSKAALLFVGHGPFFEKQTVERFIRSMRDAGAEQGFLVASGSFTVPAQRTAKEHRIVLIGREQLTELLSVGAGSEYFAKQLEQSHARLEEAKETLRQYASGLDTLRRQRNEASWYLGEEREKTATLEAQANELEQQIRRHQSEIQRWEQETSKLRKQWEESEWYLGESKVRVRYLEEQLAAFQQVATRAESEWDALRHTLSEEQAQSQSLQEQVSGLQKSLEESVGRERALQEELARLQQEIAVLRTDGDRRSHLRAGIPDAFVEVYDGEEQPIFSGAPRDISLAGIGLETDRELSAPFIRVRLRLPGRDPIESKGRLMWQRSEGQQPARYRSGCRLVGLPASVRTLIRQLVWESSRMEAG